MEKDKIKYSVISCILITIYFLNLDKDFKNIHGEILIALVNIMQEKI